MKYYGVLDFEATCIPGRKIEKQEIIEFPLVLIDYTTGDVVAEFHQYVKPKHNPTLDPFCTKLTGITQDVVNNAKPFSEVWKNFNRFLEEYKITDKNTIFVTFGNTDLQFMLPRQCYLSNIRMKNNTLLFRRWVDLRDHYGKFYGATIKNLTHMLHHAKIPLIGKQHSGIADARNTASVLKQMISHGYYLVF